MAELMITRRGGGGASLNVYAVQSADLLGTGSENDIAVITSLSIGSVYAQASAPASANEGDVYIATTGGKHTINITVSGSLEITIGAVSIYSAGAWNAAEAYVYLDGAWEKLSDAASERVYLLSGSVNAGWVKGEGSGEVTRLDQINYIQLKTGDGSTNRIHVSTAQKYSFAGKNTLCARFNPYTLTDGDVYLRVGYGDTKTTNLANLTNQCTRVTASVEKQQVEVTYDISALDGEYYVIIGIGKTNATVRFNTCYIE